MFILFLCAIITFSTVMQGMENNQFAEYQKACREIQKSFAYEKNNFCEMIYNKQLDPVKELERIEKEFDYHRNKLMEGSNTNLLHLKNFYNMDDIDWNHHMQTLALIKATIKKQINTDLPDVQQDNIIFGENKLFFANHLKKYGLDLKKICIKKNDIDNYALSHFISLQKKDRSFIIRCNTPEISISSICFNQLTSMQQRAILSIIANHMGNVDDIVLGYFSIIVENFGVVQKSEEYQKLSEEFQKCYAIERSKIAELFPCLKDYEVCQYIENLFYAALPSLIGIDRNIEHFQEICTIKNLWEKYKLLQDFVQKLECGVFI
jgi:hypothetical protein